MNSLLWRCAGFASAGLLALSSAVATADPFGDALDGGTAIDPEAFRLTGRWSSTQQSGSGLTQGQPTTITWSIVPDGTLVQPTSHGNSVATGSLLVSKFDTQFGVNTATAGTTAADLANRPWFQIFSQSFDRWSQLIGTTYVYVADDGATMDYSTTPSANRGDVRISAVTINGSSGVLAYNYYPSSGGDMVLDAADTGLISGSANNYRYGRNVVMHEHGHGLGLQHFESSNANGLMEPFLTTSFDGPQYDDILSAQRLYGDALEKSGGNDSAAKALHLGTLGYGQSASKGTNADDMVVASTETDFLSVDDETDKDYFSLTVNAFSKLTATLTPKGPTYNEGAQGGTQTSLNTAALSDLVLTLYNTNGTSILSQAELTDAGAAESITAFALPTAGTYFLSVTGLTMDAIQMYRLDVSITSAPEPATMGLLALSLTALLGRRRRRLA